jgi:UDP-N-acetylglucosamine acyltransferase
MLHPTAQIHPDARLSANVTVGPYAVIEGPAEIGEGCHIHAHAVISGRVIMGQGNTIGHGAIIGGEPQDLSFRSETVSEVRIGNRNRIRELCTVHRGTQAGSATVIGDDCYLMAGAHLGHNSELGNHIILANNVLLGGHVVVQDGVFLGGAGVFHQFIRVGRLAITQGRAGFGKDIPPFTVGAGVNFVAGLNVIGMRRAGLNAEQRQDIKRAFALLYQSGLNTSQALAAAAEDEQKWGPEAKEFFAFVASAKKRGICALAAEGALQHE